MYTKHIYILGGSASSKFALDENDKPWPAFLADQNPQFKIESKAIGGMTFVRAISALNEINPVDLIIIHVGTSVGWPSAVVDIGIKLGMAEHNNVDSIQNEFLFHQPPVPSRKKGFNLIRKKFKLKMKNFIKYILYFFGMYKPRTSIRELDDQIQALKGILHKKAKKVIWIQHQSLQIARLRVERRYYAKYYNRIILSIKRKTNDNFALLELPNSFLQPINFLLDGVHLSKQGHKMLAEIINTELSRLVED